ncbi:cyclic AMP-dependent transcription factor ATF-4-like [Lingula anatina]|uniref:Cyclic AMP-dependent transcription factor ATF-4-like n=1 Tax=Lingula anatina TaxID=7574 RepID=A0A1S3JM03_LINAN|nr:cyclic AMP-dependent transcription factor ATF-4-like [Lingula anatina]|eukprot:XP_013411151.1 cyclic AMP-dependent transcription factor ATF-4-like [Lingula anatina]
MMFEDEMNDWGDLFAPAPLGVEVDTFAELKESAGKPITHDGPFSDLADDRLGPQLFEPWLDERVDLLDFLLDEGKSVQEVDAMVTSVTTLTDVIGPAEPIAAAPPTPPPAVVVADSIEELLAQVEGLNDSGFVHNESLEGSSACVEYVDFTPPLSPEDVESILSDSGRSSPYLLDTSTVDTSVLSPGSDFSSEDDELFVQKRSRSSPYSTDPDYTVTPRVKSHSGKKPKTLDKKLRKKEQNKTAALRYRLKKREETEQLQAEADELESHNGVLKGKVEELEREIKYMKELMKEVYMAKGLIKE